MSVLNQVKNAVLLTVAFTCTAQFNLNLVTIKINQTQPLVCPAVNLQAENNKSPFKRDKHPSGSRLFDNQMG